MAAEAWVGYRNFFSFTLLALNGLRKIENVDSANSSNEHLPPPSNLNVFKEDRFTLNWTWSPSENILLNQGCNLKYRSMINEKTKERSKNLWRSEYKNSDPNDAVCLKVRAECVERSYPYGESHWIKNCTLLSPGDPATSVTNFTCVWYNKEYMNCTWQPGKRVPPDTSYILYYRYGNLKSDQQCHEYSYKNQIAIGCHFSKLELPKEGKIYFMITDSSEKIRSIYSDVDLDSILKPSAPRIANISRTSDNEISVSWSNNLWPVRDACLRSEVEYKGDALDVEIFPVDKNRSFIIRRKCFPDECCTVRVRVKINKYCLESTWSDWSQKESLGEDGGRNYDSSVIYLLMIPLVGAATIILIIFLKRILVLLFPPIPDPAKLFKGMHLEQNGVWQWTEYSEASVCSKPVKEETCSLVLMESPYTSSSEN
uniref:Interleukin-13 receptor subunit alpha-1 n=1 Tax=Geotrypetes seraphini TaxID=260995 RepID=A0A6P8RE96_GEOSA|nr:interleukin-13 receptor subunit alpha-1 [Geotrypetes seraphini]